MLSTVSSPRRVAASASTRASLPSIRPVIRVRCMPSPADDRPHEEYEPNVLHEQRDNLKETVRNSSDLKEARRKLYGEQPTDKTKVMEGAAEKGESVLDKVSGRIFEGKGHNPYPKNPQPGSRTDEEGPDARKAKGQ